jgi:hypothetical protein
MLSIEEIKLLIEKLEKVKKRDLQQLIDFNLSLLKDLAEAVDANNELMIERLDKTPQWFEKDLEFKKTKNDINPFLYKTIQTKIFQFAKTHIYNSLEIGPGSGFFSKEFRAWRKNFFLDILPAQEKIVRRRFNPAHQKNIIWWNTRKHECKNIPQNSCNFVFSWDTFVFFTQKHIQNYLNDLKRVIIPGGYVFIHYTDCHYDYDLKQAKRGYWNYNTKTAMEKIIRDEGYEIVEMNQFCTGTNYAIFRRPGNKNPFVYKINDLTLD